MGLKKLIEKYEKIARDGYENVSVHLVIADLRNIDKPKKAT